MKYGKRKSKTVYTLVGDPSTICSEPSSLGATGNEYVNGYLSRLLKLALSFQQFSSASLGSYYVCAAEYPRWMSPRGSPFYLKIRRRGNDKPARVVPRKMKREREERSTRKTARARARGVRGSNDNGARKARICIRIKIDARLCDG